MIELIVDIVLPAICLLLGVLIGGRFEKIAAAVTMVAFGLTSVATVTVWTSLEWQVLAIDTAVLVVFWWISCTSDRYWPYWVTGFQIVTVLVHLQSLVSKPLDWAYGMLSIYLSIPIVLIIGGASIMRYLR